MKLYIPNKETVQYFIIVKGEGQIAHAGSLAMMEEWKRKYNDQGLRSCIFKNNEKGIASATKYAFSEI